MKTITLKKLEIKDFRAKTLSVSFGEYTTISGENGIGKSTIMKAWNWLLSGYTDSYSPMNSALFDDKNILTPDTPTASVKAWIDIDSMEYTIERTATAKFSRKRGTTEYTKDASDQYCFYIDNIETKSNDYKAWIDSNICPNDMMTFLLDGSFLTSMIEDDKNKSRKVLEKIVGEIKEEDFNGDYSLLKEDMKKYSIEQIEERTKREIVPVKDRMQKIPAAIESSMEIIRSLQTTDYDAISKQIDRKKEEIADIDNRILGNGEAIKPILGERNHLLDIINNKTSELYAEKSKYENAKRESEKALSRKIGEISDNNYSIAREYDRTKEKIEKLKTEISYLDKVCSVKKDSYKKEKAELASIKDRVFTDDKCAYCGQELPEEMLEDAKRKFNARKKADIEKCVQNGKLLSESINSIKAEIDGKKKEIKEIEDNLEEPTIIDIKPLVESLDALKEKNKKECFEDTDIYKRLNGEIEELKSKMPELPENDNEALTEAKKSMMKDLEELNMKYGVKAKIGELKGVIEGLKQEQMEHAKKLAHLEGILAKCAEYKQEKADIISYRINGRLKECTIDMWSRQKDGTLVPDIVLKGRNGVRYSSLNFSDRIRTCIDLQSLFMEHYRVRLPIWVDESSCFSSNNFPIMDGYQMVFLFATDSPVLEVNENYQPNLNRE